MKHIIFAVVAAAALAVIGPRISQGNPQPQETAAPSLLSLSRGYSAPPRHPNAEPAHEFLNTQDKR